jgi:peroxiredoxin
MFPVLLLVLTPVFASAQEAPPAAAKPQFDEQTQQALAKVRTNLQSAQTYSYTAQGSVKMEANGQTHESGAKYTVAVKRPNKFSIQCEGGQLDGLTLLSDGQYIYTYSAEQKKFRKEETPSPVSGLTADGYLPPDPLMSFVVAFVEEDPLDSLLADVVSGAYAAKETLDGAEAERMHFALSDMEWDLWVNTGDKPFPARIKPDIAKSLAKESPQMSNIKVDMNVTFADWTVGQEFPGDKFAFKPVEGTEEVKQPEHPLSGKAAPGFSMSLLDDTKVDLAQHKGKDVVVLDFWAIRCPPCRAVMPVLEKVVDEFKGKNVVLYAVNGEDDPATIKDFLETMALNVIVARDTDNAAATAYQVEGIPQTVVIGKDGLIKYVQVGAGPGMERKFRREIAAAVSAP